MPVTQGAAPGVGPSTLRPFDRLRANGEKAQCNQTWHREIKPGTAKSNLAPRNQTWHREIKPGTAKSNLAPRNQTWHREIKPGTARAELVEALDEVKLGTARAEPFDCAQDMPFDFAQDMLVEALFASGMSFTDRPWR